MAVVNNWQIGRSMSYWYPEARPRQQFAAVFDVNKCIACQTCTLACKTTWTSGRGQEYMLWNNVETKPYGFYPLAWDVRLLEALGPQEWRGSVYEGRTIFEAAAAGEVPVGAVVVLGGRVIGRGANAREAADPTRLRNDGNRNMELLLSAGVAA